MINFDELTNENISFVTGPVDETQNTMPEILCVVQVCLEGELTKQTVHLNLSRGKGASGDLIPWTLAQQVCHISEFFLRKNWKPYAGVFSPFQFQDDDFASLSGARVVRIATHPDYQKVIEYSNNTIPSP